MPKIRENFVKFKMTQSQIQILLWLCVILVCRFLWRRQPEIGPHDQLPASIRSGRKQGLVPRGTRRSPAAEAAAAARCWPHKAGSTSSGDRSRHDVGELLPARNSSAAVSAVGCQPAGSSGGVHSATSTTLLPSHHPVLRHHYLLLLTMWSCRFHPGQ